MKFLKSNWIYRVPMCWCLKKVSLFSGFLPSNQLPTLWVLKKNRAWQPKKMRLSHAHILLARSIKFISITWNWRAVIISIVFNNEIRIEIDINKYRLFIFQKMIFLIVMLRKRCLLKISGLYTFQYWSRAIIFLFILWLVSNKQSPFGKWIALY